MLTDAVDALLKLRAAGLSHEAVIEIMIALLGIMVAVLTLIAGLISFGAAVLAFYGFSEIKRSVGTIAQETADRTAEEVAKEVATSVAIKAHQDILAAAQSNALTEGEAEELAKAEPSPPKHRGKRKATSDDTLRKQP